MGIAGPIRRGGGQCLAADCRLQIGDCRLTDWRLAIGDWIGDWRLDWGLANLLHGIAGRIAVSARIVRHKAETLRVFAEILAGPFRAQSEGMNPKALELQARTHKFAKDVIEFCETLPQDMATQKIVGQLLDAAGSTDSNYRATCRARSTDEFIAKVGVAAEEADESKGWLELLVSSNKASHDRAAALIKEADELTAIFVASRITASQNQLRRKHIARQQRSRHR